MKITKLERHRTATHAQVSALVEWEDTDRDPVTIYFEVPVAYADALAVDANAFLVAAFVPALEAGEQRIAIDGEVCPRLRTGLLTVQGLFDTWYRRDRATITVEARATSAERTTPSRAGAFFTGGIDSLATLRRNRLIFPEDHPDSVRDLILLYGINFDSDDSPESFAAAVEELSMVARDAHAELIPVRTNARRDLNPAYLVFLYQYHAALLAATAHALSGRLTTALIASSHDVPHLMAWGSHPLIDSSFSSANLRVDHDGLDLSRLAKTRLVGEWAPGLRHIKVCTRNWPGRNCGRCEKCLRTMLALEAVGALVRCDAFEAGRLDAEAVRKIQIFTKSQATFYGELVDPLRQAGREDLASQIELLLTTFRGEVGLRGQLRRFDRVYCNNGLRVLKKQVGRFLESRTAGERAEP